MSANPSWEPFVEVAASAPEAKPLGALPASADTVKKPEPETFGSKVKKALGIKPKPAKGTK